MPYLPSLVKHARTWCLPLHGLTAVGLANAISGDPRQRLSQLITLMADDPSLTLWTSCKAGQRCAGRLTTISELAGWLSLHWSVVLSWKSDELESSTVPTFVQREVWADLAATDVAAARRSLVPIGHPEYLRALLSHANVWLSTCEFSLHEPQKTEGVPLDCLPGWMSDWLSESSGDQTSMWHVEEARDEAIREQWLSDVKQCHLKLPGVVDRMRRLQLLEEEFEKTLQQEKLDSLKELAYGAGHEVNNPLANISSRAQTLLMDEQDPERRKKLATINSQAMRAHEMIADLMLFAKPPDLQPETLDLVELIDGLIKELNPQAELQGTELYRIGESDALMITADPVQLGVAVRAVCTNSLEALGSMGRIEIDICSKAEGDLDWVEIKICDSGPGLSPEASRHLFDPFYSGREAGRGLGFGLSKCWRIVSLHHGRIDVESRSGQGAVFSLVLPRDLLKVEN